MKVLEKIVNVLARNIMYTITLAVAIVLFAVFSDGLIPGLITAASALVVYVCVEFLYREYKHTSAPRPVPAKSKPAKKTVKKKK